MGSHLTERVAVQSHNSFLVQWSLKVKSLFVILQEHEGRVRTLPECVTVIVALRAVVGLVTG